MLEDLQEQEPTSQLIDALVTSASQAYLDDREALEFCAAVYNVFATADPEGMGTTWWATMDTPVPLTSIGSPTYNSSRAGCNAPSLVDEAIASRSFSAHTSPPDHVSQIGFQVAEYITTDLDADGKEEWLVWPDVVAVKPILFVPDTGGENYLVSRPSIIRPAQVSTLDIRGANGLLLAETYLDAVEFDSLGYLNEAFWETVVAIPSYRCAGEEQTGRGYLRVWYLEGNELRQKLEMPMCQPKTMAELFPDDDNPTELHGWAPLDPESDFVAAAVYRWDAAQDEFVPEFVGEIDDLEILEPEGDEISLTEILSEILSDSSDVGLRDLEEALADFDPSNDPDAAFAARYWRAVFLEASGKSDAALAEYESIHETAPSSAWRELAGLHLEPVD